MTRVEAGENGFSDRVPSRRLTPRIIDFVKIYPTLKDRISVFNEHGRIILDGSEIWVMMEGSGPTLQRLLKEEAAENPWYRRLFGTIVQHLHVGAPTG